MAQPPLSLLAVLGYPMSHVGNGGMGISLTPFSLVPELHVKQDSANDYGPLDDHVDVIWNRDLSCVGDLGEEAVNNHDGNDQTQQDGRLLSN